MKTSGSSRVLDLIVSLDKQLAFGLAAGRKAAVKSAGLTKVLFCGMGGSAIGGEILSALAARTGRGPIVVSRSPVPPKWADKNTLAIFSSYSGNTRETLEAFNTIRRTKAQMVAVTSNGRLRALADTDGITRISIPPGLPPRCAVGYLTFSLLPLLKKAGWLGYSDKDLREAEGLVRKNTRAGAPALKIARQLKGRLVHLYGFGGILRPAVLRWRAQIAENSKNQTSHHWMPEMFHNEIEGWVNPKGLAAKSTAVFLTDHEDPAWVLKKMRAAAALFKKRGGRALILKSAGKSPLARLFSMIALGDRVSWELARLNGVDPMPIPAIEAVKKIN